MINVNRYRKKRECQPSNFDLLSSFFLEIGDHVGPVAIHANESRCNENNCEQEYRDDSQNDYTCATSDGHSELPNTIVLAPGDYDHPVKPLSCTSVLEE